MPHAMTRRLIDIDIDGDRLAGAGEILGSSTMEDTVNDALALVSDTEARRRHKIRCPPWKGSTFMTPKS
ncbi:MAG TPA: hypothetical protein QGI23_11080 [Acidimicrobiales bacterium]|nr:hypothetical protein [Actinomycetes bacterium]HJM32860.1 hypothetical protein [Acidimicrobiales bacterium]